MINLSKLNLENYDFKIFIDKSGSMDAKDCPGGKSRWKQAHELSKSIAVICSQYDKDGIEVIMFDDSSQLFSNVTDSKVDEIFRIIYPSGGTAFVQAIKKGLPEYFITPIGETKKSGGIFGMFKKQSSDSIELVKRTKPVINIVFTDGEPSDKIETAKAIIHITNQISSRDEIGFTFLQVGTDKYAKQFLQFLDDELESQGAKFDIVDTKSFDECQNMSAEEILYAALTD